jgi:hypothetical protein
LDINKLRVTKNKVSYLILNLVIGFISTAALQITTECDVTSLKKELKRELKPNFKYDS